jgi:antitoxin component of MazEF toxin-antitoxin module
MPTLVKVKQWEDKLVVLIPKGFAKTRRIKVGSVLDVSALQVVNPHRRRYKLAELMAEFKPKHRQGEWEPRAPAGREIW